MHSCVSLFKLVSYSLFYCIPIPLFYAAEGCGCLAEGRGRFMFWLQSMPFLRSLRGTSAVFCSTQRTAAWTPRVWKGYHTQYTMYTTLLVPLGWNVMECYGQTALVIEESRYIGDLYSLFRALMTHIHGAHAIYVTAILYYIDARKVWCTCTVHSRLPHLWSHTALT